MSRAAETTSSHPHGEPEHLSAAPLVIAGGLLLLYLGLPTKGPLMWVGIAAFVGALVYWAKEDARLWPKDIVDPGVRPGRDLGWWAMMLFLATEVMLFAGLFGAFFFTSSARPEAWEEARAHIRGALPLVTVNTIILMTSGFTMHLGEKALMRGNRGGFKGWYIVTILLGATFLGVQVNEYSSLIAEGVTLQSGPFGSAFYLLTGTHAFHVLVGLSMLVLVLIRGFMGQFSAERHVFVNAAALYWHFVDIVWVILYFVIYVGVSTGVV